MILPAAGGRSVPLDKNRRPCFRSLAHSQDLSSSVNQTRMARLSG